MVSGTAVEESLVRTAGLTTMLTQRSPSAGDGIAGAAPLESGRGAVCFGDEDSEERAVGEKPKAARKVCEK